MTLTPTRPVTGPSIAPAVGRHRRGRPGLIPVTDLVAVRYRGWLSHLFRPPRHRARQRRQGRISS